jgi:hypothetical protein
MAPRLLNLGSSRNFALAVEVAAAADLTAPSNEAAHHTLGEVAAAGVRRPHTAVEGGKASAHRCIVVGRTAAGHTGLAQEEGRRSFAAECRREGRRTTAARMIEADRWAEDSFDVAAADRQAGRTWRWGETAHVIVVGMRKRPRRLGRIDEDSPDPGSRGVGRRPVGPEHYILLSVHCSSSQSCFGPVPG